MQYFVKGYPILLIRPVVFFFAATSLLSSCATVINTAHQKVTIDSIPQGAKVYAATPKGKKENRKLVGPRLVGLTPIRFSLSRKNGAVLLEKDGYISEEVRLKRTSSPLILGNIITGGTVGTSIDASTGASIEFDPDQYLIELRPVDPIQQQGPAQGGNPSGHVAGPQTGGAQSAIQPDHAGHPQPLTPPVPATLPPTPKSPLAVPAPSPPLQSEAKPQEIPAPTPASLPPAQEGMQRRNASLPAKEEEKVESADEKYNRRVWEEQQNIGQ